MRCWVIRVLHIVVLVVVPIVAMGLFFSGTAYAQSNPYSPYFYPDTIAPGECYVFGASYSANMTVDIQYTDPVYGALEASPWLTLDGNGQAYVCTASDQPLGTYTITAIKSHALSEWVGDSVSITVAYPPPAPPPDPTSLTISPNTGYAGIVCKTLTFGDASSMNVDMLFSLSANNPSNAVFGWGPHALNGSGQWANCDDHYSTPQVLTVLSIENADGGSWISMDPVTFTLLPPQPSSLAFSTTTVNQGGSFTWTVGNGAGVTLDVKLTQTPPDPNFPSGEWIGYLRDL